MSDQLAVFNGIDVDSGDYLLPPLKAKDFAQILVGLPTDGEAKARLNLLRAWLASRKQPSAGAIAGVDLLKLEETGWGVIFAFGANPAIKEALNPLLEHRRKQAASNGDYYHEYISENAFRPDETTAKWLVRQGASSNGPANPNKVPYYLLIVGDPQAIPYRFQYQLDLQYAVGRIYFDSLAEYDQYARSVVAAETSQPTGNPRAVFFGVHNSDDPATALSANELVKPLADFLDKDQAKWKNVPTWTIETVLEQEATKARLGIVLGGDQTPDLLFSASHGLGGFVPGDPRQERQQGSLICQDWPGPKEGRGQALSPDYFFGADDLGDDAQPGGLLAFHFACYGAGTPQMDDFSRQAFHEQTEIAPRPFVAGLPKRLLGHPRGGALAVVGHVERAWGYSFLEQGASSALVRQLDVYQSTITQLMQGYPIGLAMDYFNERFASLSIDLNQELEDISYGKQVDDVALANMWTSNNDARNFVILGDPAARISVAMGATQGAPEEKAKREPVIIAPSAIASGSVASTEQAHSQMDAFTQPVGMAITPTLAGSQPGTALPTLPPGAASYGLFDGVPSAFQEARQRLVTTLQQFTEKLGETIQKAASDMSSLEVRTYVSDNLSAVGYENGAFTGPVQLRAVTHINLDGDSSVCVPETEGRVDDALWSIHMDMVEKAQVNRAEMLKTAVSAASGLLAALKSL